MGDNLLFKGLFLNFPLQKILLRLGDPCVENRKLASSCLLLWMVSDWFQAGVSIFCCFVDRIGWGVGLNFMFEKMK